MNRGIDMEGARASERESQSPLFVEMAIVLRVFYVAANMAGSASQRHE